MAKSSLDGFITDSIADHEWLDAKDKVNAPFSDQLPYQMIGQLALEYEMPAAHPEIKVIKANALKVANEVKRQLMLGKSPQHIKETIIDRLPPELRVACKDDLVKIAKEYPLLGSVYIDPSAFEKCATGQAALGNNQSRMALFAKKMAACSGCSYNQGGMCRMYKKALVEEVPYTQKTFDHYQKHLSLSNRIASTQKISSQEELKSALLSKNGGAREAKSFVYHDESKLAPVMKTSQPSNPLISKAAMDISRDLSLKLASGMAPDLFKEYVNKKYASEYKKHPEVFQKYAALVGTLGRLYVELAPFSSMTEAREFIQRHASAVRYVLAAPGRPITTADEKFLGKKVIGSLKDIPLKAWIRNLQGKEFNAQELSSNPLAVTKKAFLQAPARPKTASAVDTLQIERETVMEAHNPAATQTAKVEAKRVSYNKRNASSKVVDDSSKYAKPSFAPDNKITESNGKVSVNLGKNLEIEMEQVDFDQSVKNYI